MAGRQVTSLGYWRPAIFVDWIDVMPAIPQRISLEPGYRRGSFEARYPGVCVLCGDAFPAGAICHYNVNDEVVCCDQDASDDEDFSSCRGRPSDIPVMPRGKTKADRCDRCFMIHASRQVECE